ncbi:MAG: hypothetical protein ACD_77C00416G0001 [uncultured bacterium]|nr:MAG: hypothetical protein ACD_77C00416G0001 [uncultured bacterium]
MQSQFAIFVMVTDDLRTIRYAKFKAGKIKTIYEGSSPICIYNSFKRPSFWRVYSGAFYVQGMDFRIRRICRNCCCNS